MAAGHSSSGLAVVVQKKLTVSGLVPEKVNSFYQKVNSFAEKVNSFSKNLAVSAYFW